MVSAISNRDDALSGVTVVDQVDLCAGKSTYRPTCRLVNPARAHEPVRLETETLVRLRQEIGLFLHPTSAGIWNPGLFRGLPKLHFPDELLRGFKV